MLNILFLCTGNSCRSILAEGLLNHFGSGKFTAYSAGSFPAGYVHPISLEILREKSIDASNFRSKSWDEFLDKQIDIVITVCDSAAGESCPIFPGKPLKTHWGVTDPAKFEGTEEAIKAEFLRVAGILERRIKALIQLETNAINKASLDAIGREIN